MGGHSTTTTNTNVENIHDTTNTHNINHLSQTTNTHLTRNTRNVVDGNVVDGRSVRATNSGNNGLQCFGMAANDKRCHLQNLMALKDLGLLEMPVLVLL